VIALEDVTVAYGSETVIGPITLEVPAHHVLAVLGPSGCGKSTLLRAMVGLVLPQRGRVTISGESVNAATRVKLRRRIGYVIQEGGLFPHLTAAGNAALLARNVGWDDERIQGRIGELAALTNLEPSLLDRYPAQLSGGQRQRVGLVRALMLDPDVLLMDEPLGALDPVIRARLQTELAGLFRRLRKTVVVVTHDVAEASFLADEAIVMRAGRIVQRGSLEELAQAPSDPFVEELFEPSRAPLARGSP
jgi:osmoprotectant transport system ATP-binding protein